MSKIISIHMVWDWRKKRVNCSFMQNAFREKEKKSFFYPIKLYIPATAISRRKFLNLWVPTGALFIPLHNTTVNILHTSSQRLRSTFINIICNFSLKICFCWFSNLDAITLTLFWCHFINWYLIILLMKKLR